MAGLHMNLLLTLAVAAVGGVLAKRLRVPSGAMVGSLFFVILFEILTQRSFFPVEIKVYLQVLSGALVGQKLSRGDFSRMRALLLPIGLQVVLMLSLNIVFGLLMIYVNGLDVATGLFSCAPGGVQDMALIASDYGADPLYVSLIQMFRLIIIVMFMPSFYLWLLRRRSSQPVSTRNREPEAPAFTPAKTRAAAPLSRPLRFLITLAVAAAGGFLLRALGVRSGALIGAIASTALLNIFTRVNYLPRYTKEFTQICVGAYVGAMLSYESLFVLPRLAGPIVIMLLGLFAFVYGSGLLMMHLTHFDFLTCLLMCTPGGIQEMTLMAQDMECDLSKVTILHVVRVLVTLSLFPPLIGLLSSLLSRL